RGGAAAYPRRRRLQEVLWLGSLWGVGASLFASLLASAARFEPRFLLDERAQSLVFLVRQPLASHVEQGGGRRSRRSIEERAHELSERRAAGFFRLCGGEVHKTRAVVLALRPTAGDPDLAQPPHTR